ncbi:glycosyltransferase [Janibacter alittae]|uniref:Glycosyltransferase n=1 Tax=Janibacter alittae TaxID=3115209 RepID=A0ABZ2MGF7_9MICO
MTSTTRPLRCAIVTAYGGLGGSERWLLSVLTTTRRLDARVVMLQDGPLRSRLIDLGIDVTVLPTGPSGGDIARSIRALTAYLREPDPEVVLANGVKAAAAAVPAARITGVPVVWAKHDFSFDSALGPLLARLSDAVLATSEAVGQAAPASKVVLVPPPRPPLDVLDRTAARERWRKRGTPLPHGPVLAMVGRIVGYKGIDTAVRSLPEAPGWHLVVVGTPADSEPEETHRLARLAASLGVSDRVMFVGEMEDVAGALRAVDAVAVLTRRAGHVGREGYSMVGLEALAARVPLIGAQGNPEVVRMATAGGVVVPVDDPRAVAAALCDLRPGEPASSAGHRLIQEHPDAAQVAGQVAELLAHVALRPGAGLSGPPMTVLTCFRNEAGHIDGVVSAVMRQLRVDDEYLLVDDQSEDGTAAELRAWATRDHRIKVLRGPGINLSAARNHGFEHASSSYVACTDAGVLPHEDWLDTLRAAFAEPGDVDLVVGSFDVDDGSPSKAASRLALFPDPEHTRRRTPLRRVRARLRGGQFRADRLDGRSMACSLEAWRRAGGFDETLSSSEDAIFGYAVRDSGGRSVLSLAARVTWEQPDSLLEMMTTFRKYGYWGGRAGSTPLIAKDMSRVAAMMLALGLATAGGTPGRRVAALGATGYLGLPVTMAIAAGASPGVIARMPFLLLLKDSAKAAGCTHGLVDRARAHVRGMTR